MNRKTASVITLAAVAALIVAAIVALALDRRSTPSVASYRVDEPLVSLMEQTLAAASGRNRYPIKRLDPLLSLKEQQKALKRHSILLTMQGTDPELLSSLSLSVPDEALSLLPSAQRKGAAVDGKPYGLPLLSDNVELAWNKAETIKAGLAFPCTLDDFESAMKRLSTTKVRPLVCEGGSDRALLLFVSALIEARSGRDAYRAVLAKAQAGEDTLSDESVQGAIALLSRWRKSGMIHPEWFRLSSIEVQDLMEAQLAPLVVMSLSSHRSVPQRVIERYDSSFFPGPLSGTARGFLSPTLIAVPIGLRGSMPQASNLVASLASLPIQKRLSDATGLAPVHAGAEPRDKQASDARLWIAASSGALPSLETAFPTEVDFTAFAAALREAIKTAP